MKHRLALLLYNSDLYGTRFLLGLAEILWAISLFWAGNTFGRPTYHGMQAVASEEVWAFTFLITGIIQWTLLYRNEYHSTRGILFAFCNSALWIFCVISMYMSVYPPPAAISGETALAIGASWIFVRSGWHSPSHNRREHDIYVSRGAHK